LFLRTGRRRAYYEGLGFLLRKDSRDEITIAHWPT
jgi:hypothetical protein